MFINEDIVAIIFRLINFISVIALGLYIFKKYSASDIENMMAEQVSAQKALQDQHLILEKKQYELDTVLKEELLLGEQFKNKIDEWKDAVALESAFAEKQHATLKNVLITKINQRSLQKEHDRVQELVITQLLPELQESLSAYFVKEHNNAHYLNSIIHFMNERI